MGKLKIIIIAAIVLILGVGVGLFFLLRPKKVHVNPPEYVGNTAGNLYNSGLFCEYEDTIFFSNMMDDGCLYSMDLDCNEVKKLYSDKVKFINADAENIFYSRINYERPVGMKSMFTTNNTGVYRVNHKGKKFKTLNGQTAGVISLYENTIFFQNYDSTKGLFFYQMDTSGKNSKMLTEDAIIPASYYQESLYYAGATYDHDIHTLNMNNLSPRTIYHGSAAMPIATENGIYFLSIDDNFKLCKVDYAGNKTVLVDDFVATYNISMDLSTIYYQIDAGDHNQLGKLDLKTMKTESIRLGDYKEINVTSRFVFFRDYNNRYIYSYHIKTGEINIFQPPVEKD